MGPTTPPDECDWLDVTHDELDYVCAEVWRGRCAVTRTKLERKPLALCRWWGSRRSFKGGGCNEVKVLADELILLVPALADNPDAALDACTSDDNLFDAAASALGSRRSASIVDARISDMRLRAGGPWAS